MGVCAHRCAPSPACGDNAPGKPRTTRVPHVQRRAVRLQHPPVAPFRADCTTLLAIRRALALAWAAGTAGAVAAGANRLQRVVQPRNRRIHVRTGRGRRRPLLGIHPALHPHPGGGRAHLCAVLLRAGLAGPALAALAHAAFSGALFRPARLLPAERHRGHRQPRPAHCRRHQRVHPAVAVFFDDRAGLGHSVDRVFERAVDHLARAGLFSDRLCHLQHRVHCQGVWQAADRAELPPAAARGRFPLQPGAGARARRAHRLSQRRAARNVGPAPHF